MAENGRPELAGRRILVVEDLFQIAQMLDDMLRALGCEVVGPVPRLDRAIALAREAAIDGAVLDVNIDGRDVSPVAEALEARGVPFLFVTGYDRLDGLPARFQTRPRVKKPFALDRLDRALRQALAEGC